MRKIIFKDGSKLNILKKKEGYFLIGKALVDNNRGINYNLYFNGEIMDKDITVTDDSIVLPIGSKLSMKETFKDEESSYLLIVNEESTLSLKDGKIAAGSVLTASIYDELESKEKNNDVKEEIFQYELEIDDDTSLSDQMNIFTVLVPILNQDTEESGIINRSNVVYDIRETIRGCLATSICKGTVEDDFAFYKNPDFYKTIYDTISFLDIINNLKDIPKLFIEAISFYNENILDTSKKVDEDTLKYFTSYSNYIRQMNILSEENIPDMNSGCKDFSILYFLDKENKEYDVTSILKVKNNKEKEYSSLMTKESISLLIKNKILTIKSFLNIFEGDEDIDEEKLISRKDLITYTLNLIMEAADADDKKDNIIKFLKQCNVQADEFKYKFFSDIINELLLTDSPNMNSIKSKWMRDSLATDSGIKDDPFDD